MQMPTLQRPAAACAFRLCGLAMTASACMAQAAPASAEPDFSFDLPAQPLATALAAVRQTTGMALRFAPEPVAGKTAPALSGRMTARQAVMQLLRGSGLSLADSSDGGVILQVAATEPLASAPPSAAQAATASATPTPPPAPADTHLHTIRVRARRTDDVGQQALDKRAIDTLPQLNGDITSLLKINPQVQFDEQQASSATGGEIGPAEVSIHGAKAYQSEFLVDGMSVANAIDPGNKSATGSFDLISGAAQALALDADLVCDVTVHDANISAAHGHFTGGVVDAKTCNATRPLGGKVSVAYTSSRWTHLIIDPRREQAFDNSSTEDEQPRFTKYTYRALLEGRPSDEWGWVASVVRKQSVIPLKLFSSDYQGSPIGAERDQKRTLDNFFLKTDWTPGGRTRAEASVTYAPSDSEYFRENTRDGGFHLKGGGLGLNGLWAHEVQGALLTHQLTHTQIDQSRRSALNAYYKPWRWSEEKNWGDPTNGANPASAEGSYGDVDQTLQTSQYKLKSAWPSFRWGGWKQQLETGLELTHQGARYERLADTASYSSLKENNTGSCTDANGIVDTAACSLSPTAIWPGQYFRTRQTYRAGERTQQANSWSAYAEQTAQRDDWRVRLGLRVDREGLTGNTDLAPRSQLTWQASEAWRFDVGANRYYGRSLFAYALQEKINELKTSQTRTAPTLPWSAPSTGKPTNRLEDIRTPYDDEVSAAATWQLADSDLSLQYTERRGHDQVIKRLSGRDTACENNRCDVYANDGKSRAQDLTLTWKGRRALSWRSSRTTLWLAANQSRIVTNHSSYEQTFSDDRASDEVVRYNGEFIRYSEMPADNYNRPWTLRLAASTAIPQHHLQLTQLLRVRDGYKPAVKARNTVEHDGMQVEAWDRTSLPRALTWDTTVLWQPRVAAEAYLELKLTIENLTDRKNQLTTSDGYATYERGRTFLLSLGYGF